MRLTNTRFCVLPRNMVGSTSAQPSHFDSSEHQKMFQWQAILGPTLTRPSYSDDNKHQKLANHNKVIIYTN